MEESPLSVRNAGIICGLLNDINKPASFHCFTSSAIVCWSFVFSLAPPWSEDGVTSSFKGAERTGKR